MSATTEAGLLMVDDVVGPADEESAVGMASNPLLLEASAASGREKYSLACLWAEIK